MMRSIIGLTLCIFATCTLLAEPAWAKISVGKKVEVYGDANEPQVLVTSVANKEVKQVLVEIRNSDSEQDKTILLCRVETDGDKQNFIPEEKKQLDLHISFAAGQRSKQMNLTLNKKKFILRYNTDASAQQRGLDLAKRYLAQGGEDKSEKTSTDGKNENSNRLKFLYRAELVQRDNGLELSKGSDKQKSSTIENQLYLNFQHKLDTKDGPAHDATIKVRLRESSLEDEADKKEKPDLVEVLAAEVQFGTYMSIAAGQMLLNLGGFEGQAYGSSPQERAADSQYFAKRLPLFDINNEHAAPTIQIAGLFGVAGRLSLQLTNDVLPQDADEDGSIDWAYVSQRHQQPAGILQWNASWGPITPLLQFASYDTNHSRYVSAGAKLVWGGIEASGDYSIDQRAAKPTDKIEQTTYTNTVVDLLYRNSYVSPFVKYAKFNAIQPDIDYKGNDPILLDNDNATLISGGLNFSFTGSALQPHLVYTRRSIDVLTNARDPYVAETRQQTEISFGLHGAL